MNGWAEAITRLRARTGVAPALAAALVLTEARGRWEDRVVVATAGNDLLFSRPGDTYPFPCDVRVSLIGRTYDVWWTGDEPGRVEATAAHVDEVVDRQLAALLAP